MRGGARLAAHHFLSFPDPCPCRWVRHADVASVRLGTGKRNGFRLDRVFHRWRRGGLGSAGVGPARCYSPESTERAELGIVRGAKSWRGGHAHTRRRLTEASSCSVASPAGSPGSRPKCEWARDQRQRSSPWDMARPVRESDRASARDTHAHIHTSWQGIAASQTGPTRPDSVSIFCSRPPSLPPLPPRGPRSPRFPQEETTTTTTTTP